MSWMPTWIRQVSASTKSSNCVAIAALSAGLRRERICQYYFDLMTPVGSAAHASLVADEVGYRRNRGELLISLPLFALVGVEQETLAAPSYISSRTQALMGLQGRQHRERWSVLDSVYSFERPRPYLHLSALTVMRPFRGRGYAGRWLDDLDPRGQSVFLETATPANRSLYERHGFRVVEERALPPTWTLWSMVREP